MDYTSLIAQLFIYYNKRWKQSNLAQLGLSTPSEQIELELEKKELSELFSVFQQVAKRFDSYSYKKAILRGEKELNDKTNPDCPQNPTEDNGEIITPSIALNIKDSDSIVSEKRGEIDNSYDESQNVGVASQQAKGASIAGQQNPKNKNLQDTTIKGPWDLDYIFRTYWLNNHMPEIQDKYMSARYADILNASSKNTLKEFGPLGMIIYKMPQVKDDIHEKGRTTMDLIGSGMYKMSLGIKCEGADFFYVSDVSMDFDFSKNFKLDMKESEKGVESARALYMMAGEGPLTCQEAISSPSFDDTEIIQYKADLLRTQTAKAAIMSRNVSHNLGSHVLSYLYNEMESLTKTNSRGIVNGLKKQTKETFSNNESGFSDGTVNLDVILDGIDSVFKGFIDDNEKNANYIQGIRHLVSYVQERQDYIACIATQEEPSFTIINFKDDVYDFLNPDKKGLRHNKESVNKVDNLLLHYMMRSEGIERPLFVDQILNSDEKSSVIVKFGNFSGDEKANNDLETMRNWNIAVPGGTMGRQAFFSIIENMLRNAAKHDSEKIKASKKMNLELSIDCYDKTSYERADESLKKVFKDYYLSNDFDEDYYYVSLTLNVKVEEDTLKALREAVCENYIDPTTHQMIEKNKGIKEMRISAAWLRSEQEPLRKIIIPEESANNNGEYNNSLNHRPPILFVRKTSDGYLQYIICLLKPKQLAYVLPDNSTNLPEYPPKWGWKAFRKTDYSRLRRNVFATTVVVDDADYTYVRPYSGYRCFKESDLKDCNVANCASEDNRNAILSELYKLSANVDGEDCAIYIVDDSTEVESIDNTATKYIIKCDSDSDKSVPAGSYEYYSHYEPGYSKPQALSIDAITGGNSTDRIVRHEMKNLLWFYRHIGALKCRVAIFDERLFDRMSNDNKIALRNSDRRVHVFTIETDENSDKILRLDDVNRTITTVCIATIKKNESVKEMFTIELAVSNFPKYDFITIHQGLFDKLYDKYCIKNNKEAKEKLLAAFHKAFCVEDNPEHQYKDGFRPGVIIHSGRSKPAADQMPAWVPFIPYSALERYVSDCKYTLVELLYNAKTTNSPL